LKKSKKFKTHHLFYVSCLKFLYNCFLKFVVHEINSEMVKSVIVVLTEREKSDVTDTNVVVCWML
jgi:hypothetical protein